MSEERDFTLVHTGSDGDYEHYRIAAGAMVSDKRNSVAEEYGSDTVDIYDDGAHGIPTTEITVRGRGYKYVRFGEDDQLPYAVNALLRSNMVTAQCQYFNILACYGQGVRFVDRATRLASEDADIRRFCLRNSLHEVFLEQSTDMKTYFFSVTVIILDNKGEKIVKVRNKDAMFCRFTLDRKHVLFGDFRPGLLLPDELEVVPLLDVHDPLGDLLVRMGMERDPKTGELRRDTDRKFAIVSRMSTPGCSFYPMPYYSSIFRDEWYDIYRLIGIGKKHLIKNTSAPRVQIEIHRNYWTELCAQRNVTDAKEMKRLIEEEQQKIIDFVCGVENAGKAIISNYYIDPNGKENRMVRFTQISDTGHKEGGHWSEDMSEASNALCFAFGIHPNLVGATPGKSQMNNSGSDKRELFTLKQALEKPLHDVMLKPYHVILHFNGWAEKATVDVPMIQLTTLDKHTDAEEKTIHNS